MLRASARHISRRSKPTATPAHSGRLCRPSAARKCSSSDVAGNPRRAQRTLGGKTRAVGRGRGPFLRTVGEFDTHVEDLKPLRVPAVCEARVRCLLRRKIIYRDETVARQMPGRQYRKQEIQRVIDVATVVEPARNGRRTHAMLVAERINAQMFEKGVAVRNPRAISKVCVRRIRVRQE